MSNHQPNQSLLDQPPTSQTRQPNRLPAATGPSRPALIGAAVAAGLVIGAGGFIGGMQYQKNHSSATPSSFGGMNPGGQSQFGQGGAMPGGGPRGANFNGSAGKVTNISASSITVQDQRSGGDKTYAITADTKVLKQGQSAAIGDISSGDQVFVQASDSDSNTASQIMIGL